MASERAALLAICLALIACEDPSYEAGFDPLYEPLTAFDAKYAQRPLDVGYLLLAQGDHNNALRAFTSAISKEGVSSDVLIGLGAANFGLGRVGQAETFLRAAVEKDPDSVPAWNNLGVVLENKKDLHGAVNAFRTAFLIEGGDTKEVRQNLFAAEKKLVGMKEEQGIPEEPEFILERRGHGRYVLKKNSTKG